MPGVSPAGLRLGRLGQVRLSTDPVEFLDDELSARRCLKRDLEPATAELLEARPGPDTVRRHALARGTSPVIVSIHSAEICARC